MAISREDCARRLLALLEQAVAVYHDCCPEGRRLALTWFDGHGWVVGFDGGVEGVKWREG